MADKFTIDDGTVLSIPDHVLSRKASGETVLLSLADEHYYGLDGVGSRLWELIAEGTTFGEAVATLSAEYDVEAGVLRTDLGALLAELDRSDLVRAEHAVRNDSPDARKSS